MNPEGDWSFTYDREVEARRDALFHKGEEEAENVADAVEDDDGEVPSGSVGRVDVHERIRPEASDARAVQSPLQEAVRGAPEDEVADAEPREAEAVQRKFDGEEHKVHGMHVDVDETVADVRGEKQRHEEPPVDEVREDSSGQDRLKYTLSDITFHSCVLMHLPPFHKRQRQCGVVVIVHAFVHASD